MVLKELKSEKKLNSYMRSRKVRVIMFTMDNCPACNYMKNILESKYKQVTVLVINYRLITNANTLAGVQGYPSFGKYMNGKRLDFYTGADEERFKKMINS